MGLVFNNVRDILIWAQYSTMSEVFLMCLLFYNERGTLIWAQYSTMSEVFLYGLSIVQ